MLKKIMEIIERRRSKRFEAMLTRRRDEWRAECAALGIPEQRYSDTELIHVERIVRRPIGIDHQELILTPWIVGIEGIGPDGLAQSRYPLSTLSGAIRAEIRKVRHCSELESTVARLLWCRK